MAKAKKPLESIVFFGTPEFALPTLAALHAAGRTPVLVVSQPARPAGRGKELKDPPVAEWARQHGVELVASRDRPSRGLVVTRTARLGAGRE